MSDAVVIGGGIIGLAAAWRLQQRGLDTLLIERDEPGRKASWSAAGMLTPVSEANFTEAELTQLGLRSLRMYPDFVAEVEGIAGQSVDYDQSGTFIVALDADEARQFRRLLEFQQRIGLDAAWVPSGELLEREPMLSPRVVGAITAPGDYQIDNRKLVDALAVCFRKAGGQIRTGAEVDAVVIEAERVTGVLVGGERVSTDRVLIAAGAWSGRVGGLPEALRPPIRPVRGQILTLQAPPDAPLAQHVIRGRRAYCVPRPDGRLIVGATSEERGFDASLTAGGVYELLRGVYELLPGSYEAHLTDLYVGLRPACRDSLPIIGDSPVEGLFFATGHYRSGILLTPVTAWAIAETVVSGAVPESLKPFTIHRFLEA